MQNQPHFQNTPVFGGNFTSNAGAATQSLWGETTGYGYNWGGTTPHGIPGAQANLASHPLLQAIGGTLGFNAPSTHQEIFSTFSQAQTFVQHLFSENGLVLGPISGGADSFFGTRSEGGQFGAISRFVNLTQGVSSAQAIAHTGILGAQNIFGYGTNQTLGNGMTQGSFNGSLASLIQVRYFDNPSSFVIESAIVGGNSKNLNVTVVGEEIRIQKTEATTSTGRNVVTIGNQGNASTYYSLPLPNTADSKGITAMVKDGILTITLPKTQGISKNVHQITVK